MVPLALGVLLKGQVCCFFSSPPAGLLSSPSSSWCSFEFYSEELLAAAAVVVVVIHLIVVPEFLAFALLIGQNCSPKTAKEMVELRVMQKHLNLRRFHQSISFFQ